MKAEITIYKPDGTPRMTAIVGKGSVRVFLLMEKDYITLKFATAEAAYLRLGDYVDIEGLGRYELTAPCKPEQDKSTLAFNYEIQLDAQYRKFKNKLMKFLPMVGTGETAWSYTDTLPNHARQIIDNLKALAYTRDASGHDILKPRGNSFRYRGIKDWEVEWDASVDSQKVSTQTYDSTNIIDAITAIAEAHECEWWFEENVLHFGKCEYGTTPVNLAYGKEVVDISRKDSRESYATRIFAYGSDRNIPSNYRKDLIFTADSVTGDTFKDTTRPLDASYFPEAMRTSDPADTKTIQISGGGRNLVENTGGATASVAFFSSTSRTSGITPGFWDLDFSQGSVATVFNNPGQLLTAKSELVLKFNYKNSFLHKTTTKTFTVDTQVYSGTAPITMASFENQRIEIKRNVESLEATLTLYVNLPRNSSVSPATTCDFKLVLTNKYGNKGVSGLKVNVINTRTGGIARVIDGVNLNPEFVKEGGPLKLPAGATVSVGDKFTIPAINKAVVPASYFTNKYTVFVKYQDIVTNGIVNRCLLLPEFDGNGTPLKGYIDVPGMESEEEAVEDVVVFSDIYPSRESKVLAVETETKHDKENEQDGSTTDVPWTSYSIKDDLFNESNPFNKEYLIEDKDLQVTFQTGMLTGMTFDVAYTDGHRFEIQRDSKTLLPNEVVKPQVGDIYILSGFNIAMLNDGNTDYISGAEARLLEKAKEYVERLNTDTQTYECTIGCDYAKSITEGAPDGLCLGIGRRVNLIHPAYFENGRISRVIGYEVPLDIPYDNPKYTIGEKAQYTRFGAIEDQLKGLETKPGSLGGLYGGGTGGTGNGSPYVIQQVDDTPPTDKNVYSALRSRLEFVLKNAEQTISHLWSFLRGIRIGDFSTGVSGAAIDDVGNAEVESLQARGTARVGRRLDVGEYVPGASGASVWIDDRGEAHIETATITVNKKMTVKEVEIQEQAWVGGSQINSPAGMTCEKVEEILSGGAVVAWTCSFRATDADGREVNNQFKEGDLARCETFNLVKDGNGMTVNRYYWRRVSGIGTGTDADGTKWHHVVLSNAAGNYDPDSTCGPAPGDRVITVGSATEPDRQNVVITASYGAGSPYIYQYVGVDSFTLAGKLKTAISPEGNIFTGRFLMEAADGSTRDVARSVSSLEVKSDGIMGKVGMISRNLVPCDARWDSSSQEFAMECLPEAGGFTAEEAACPSEWQAFFCEVDFSLFKPSTDYVLTLEASFQDEDEESVVSAGKMAFRAGVGTATQQTMLCPFVAPEGVNVLTPGEYTPLTFRLRSASVIPKEKMYLRFVIRDWEDRTSLLRLDFREIKLEEGRVATPWVSPDKDVWSAFSQQADRIGMAVMVDGQERAGLALDAQEGITLAADKVRIKNGSLTAALFAGGVLNADLMQVGKLATIVGGLKRITVSEHDDGFIRFYHDDGATVAMKLGLDSVSLDEQQSITPILPQSDDGGEGTARAASSVVLKPTLKGKPAIMQVFDTDGKLTWVLFLDGPVTPDTQTYSWRAWSLVRETAQNSASLKTASTLKAQEYWQFKVKSGVTSDYSTYRDRLFIRKMSDTDFASAASYYVPDGRYFYPSAELAPATTANPTMRYIRRYFTVTGGRMTSGQMEVTQS